VAADIILLIKAIGHHVQGRGTALLKPTGQVNPVVGGAGLLTKYRNIPLAVTAGDYLLHQAMTYRPIAYYYQSLCHIQHPHYKSFEVLLLLN
jgi:hypothetical protein